MFYVFSVFIIIFLLFIIFRNLRRKPEKIESERKDCKSGRYNNENIKNSINYNEIELKLSHQFENEYDRINIIEYDDVKIMATAFDSVNRNDVVITTLNIGLQEKEEAIKSFTKELEAIKCVNHPNLIRILKIGNNENFLYYVTEKIKGRSLNEALKDQESLALSVVIDFAKQILKGLLHLHNNSIIHRNITLDSIFVNDKGILKLTDFGLAKTGVGNFDSVKESTMVGDCLFAAPEQIKGKNLSAKSDIFSLGVSLFFMLAHTFPFDNSLLLLDDSFQIKDLKKLCPDLDSVLTEMIMNSLSVDVEKRPSSLDMWKVIREIKI